MRRPRRAPFPADAGPCGAIVLIASLLVAGACGGPARPGTELVLASTTSTYDSGLLDVLLPAFEATHAGVRVRLVAVGSGQALELGRRGDADVLLVHAPDAEMAFMRAGHGRSRAAVMCNDFVIVGPPVDPAGAAAAPDAAAALRRIAGSGAAFISRGDDSGTQLRELRLWQEAGWPAAAPAAPVRVEVGQGMSETLAIASERQAYTLTDRATYVALASSLLLDILYEGDATLLNPYSVITVAGVRNERGADLFASWIMSAAAARVIAEFGGARPVFTPGSCSP